MSDGRKRLSGAKYRKNSLEKSERQRSVVEKSTKIDTFFKKTTKTSVSVFLDTEQSTSAAAEPNSSDIDIVSRSPQIYSSILTQTAQSETASAPGPSNSCSNSNNSDDKINFQNFLTEEEVATCTDDTTKPTTKISNDPALWDINEVTRDYVSKHAVKQDIDTLDFNKSKRAFGDQYRYCSPSLFNTVVANGENSKRLFSLFAKYWLYFLCAVSSIWRNHKIGNARV